MALYKERSVDELEPGMWGQRFDENNPEDVPWASNIPNWRPGLPATEHMVEGGAPIPIVQPPTSQYMARGNLAPGQPDYTGLLNKFGLGNRDYGRELYAQTPTQSPVQEPTLFGTEFGKQGKKKEEKEQKSKYEQLEEFLTKFVVPTLPYGLDPRAVNIHKETMHRMGMSNINSPEGKLEYEQTRYGIEKQLEKSMDKLQYAADMWSKEYGISNLKQGVQITRKGLGEPPEQIHATPIPPVGTGHRGIGPTGEVLENAPVLKPYEKWTSPAGEVQRGIPKPEPVDPEKRVKVWESIMPRIKAPYIAEAMNRFTQRVNQLEAMDENERKRIFSDPTNPTQAANDKTIWDYRILKSQDREGAAHKMFNEFMSTDAALTTFLPKTSLDKYRKESNEAYQSVMFDKQSPIKPEPTEGPKAQPVKIRNINDLNKVIDDIEGASKESISATSKMYDKAGQDQLAKAVAAYMGNDTSGKLKPKTGVIQTPEEVIETTVKSHGAKKEAKAIREQADYSTNLNNIVRTVAERLVNKGLKVDSRLVLEEAKRMLAEHQTFKSDLLDPSKLGLTY